MKKTTSLILLFACLSIMLLGWIWSRNTGTEYHHDIIIFDLSMKLALILSLFPSFHLAKSELTPGAKLFQQAYLFPVMLMLFLTGPVVLLFIGSSLGNISIAADRPPG